ncbi:MAG: GIY-YIG nuclease family protein [Patescibacteria group bacterium]
MKKQSNKNGRYYTGSTDDMENRLKCHNSGWVAATKNYRPFKLLAFLPCANLSEARKSEYRLKQYKRKDILEKVVADLEFPWLHKV